MKADYFQKGLTAYREIFWPVFTEHDDCVFLSFDEAVYKEWLEKTGGDRRKIEATMNHRHIIDLLPASVKEPTKGLVVEFGDLLREVWEAKLQRDFPRRRFCVSFTSENDNGLDLLGNVITVFQTA